MGACGERWGECEPNRGGTVARRMFLEIRLSFDSPISGIDTESILLLIALSPYSYPEVGSHYSESESAKSQAWNSEAGVIGCTQLRARLVPPSRLPWLQRWPLESASETQEERKARKEKYFECGI